MDKIVNFEKPQDHEYLKSAFFIGNFRACSTKEGLSVEMQNVTDVTDISM